MLPESQSAHNTSIVPIMQAAPSQVLTELVSWAATLPLWQQEAIRRLFRKDNLTAEDLDDLYKLAAIEHHVVEGKVDCQPLSSADLPISTSAKANQLLGLKHLTNVNAIKSDQELVIGPRLTIIYGDNGSGKSGYARVMKRACRARSVEPILRDVYDPQASKDPASATFVFHDGQSFKDSRWTDLGNSPSWLGRFAVFDSKCIPLYVAEKMENPIMPFGLDVLPKLANIVEQVKQRFDSAAKASIPSIEPLKNNISRRSAVYKLLAELQPETRPEFVNRLAEFSDADVAKLENLRSKHASMRANTAENIRNKLSEQKKYLSQFSIQANKLVSALSVAEVQQIRQTAEQLTSLNQAAEIANKNLSKSILTGAGSSPWKELILAAERYSQSHAYPAKEFPAPDSSCVLCQQPLSPDAEARMQQFVSFVKSETESKRIRTKQQQDSQLRVLQSLPVSMPDYEPSLRAILGDEGVAALSAFLQVCANRIDVIKNSIQTGRWQAFTELTPLPPCISAANASIDKELSTITDEKGLAEVLDVVAIQVEELEAKRALKNNMALVHEHIKALQLKQKNKSAADTLSTRSISVKVKDMQEQFVTDKFRADFKSELERIGLACSLPVISEQSQKGKVFRKLAVSGAGEADSALVFSEGESTAIAIALFLAEIGSEDETSGVIFDDPVDSLDHRVREAITDRLVELALTRQVIVFTHDLVFYRALAIAATKHQVETKVQCISRLGRKSGLVTARPPWSAAVVKERLKDLRELLQKAKAAEEQGNVDQFNIEARMFYERLRETWERSVEEVIFNGVIQRLEPAVATQKLTGVVVDDDTVKAMFEGMSKASERVHDNAAGVRIAAFTLDDVRKDLEIFEAFVKKHREKSEAVEKARSHIKGKFTC